MRLDIKPRMWIMYILIIVVAVIWSMFETKPDLSEVQRLAENKQYQEALQAVDYVLEQYPDNLDALSEKGAVLLELGKTEEALLALARVVENEPAHEAALNDLARGYQRLELYRLANYYIDRALLIGTNSAEQYVTKANIELGMKNYTNALKYFDIALALDASSENAALGKGLIYYKKERYQDAILWLEKHREAFPDDQEAGTHVVSAYLKLKDYEGAIGEYRRQLERNPQNYAAAVAMGKIYVIIHDYDNAVAAFDTVIQQSPAYAPAYYEKALCLAGVRDYDAACANLALAIQYDPEYLHLLKDEPKLKNVRNLPQYKKLFI